MDENRLQELEQRLPTSEPFGDAIDADDIRALIAEVRRLRAFGRVTINVVSTPAEGTFTFSGNTSEAVELRRALFRIRDNSTDPKTKEFVDRVLVGDSVHAATNAVAWRHTSRGLEAS
jgi:hypothetical protein